MNLDFLKSHPLFSAEQDGCYYFCDNEADFLLKFFKHKTFYHFQSEYMGVKNFLRTNIPMKEKLFDAYIDVLLKKSALVTIKEFLDRSKKISLIKDDLYKFSNFLEKKIILPESDSGSLYQISVPIAGDTISNIYYLSPVFSEEILLESFRALKIKI